MSLLENTAVTCIYAPKASQVYGALTTQLRPLPRGRDVLQQQSYDLGKFSTDRSW